LSKYLSREPAFIMHLLALLEMYILNVFPKVSLNRDLLYTLGFFVIIDFFIEKHLWNLWP
jgi:hypothetical protein